MPEITHPTETIDPDDVAFLPDEILPDGHVVASRYEIRGVLGKGGYAVVYRALDLQLGVEIALKILRAERSSGAALKRFHREVRLPRDVSSSHIVRVYDIGTDGPLSYLTMELVAGESLRDRLNRGTLALDEVIRISRDILQGVDALHTARIIHRDIKPENVLLDGESVKVADFGLSRYLDDEKGSTVSNALVGTLRYLPPEHLLGAGVDGRSDLYTVGLLMFEMLAGRTPFAAESSVGVMLNRLQSPAPDVRRFRPDTPPWLANLIARLLEREPGARYAAARDVIAALDSRRASRPVSARRRLAWISVSVVIALVAVIAVITATRAAAANRFSRLVAPPQGGIAAISAGGRTLWHLANIDPETAGRWALARLTPAGKPVLAVILHTPTEVALDRVTRLSFLDPQSGTVIETVRLPSNLPSFPRSPARFYPGRIVATDTNGDGVDEIITWFGHVPEWASFVDLYDPHSRQAWTIFEGYGQHGIAGLFDINGDGRKELVLFGYNNGLGWYNAMAVLRLDAQWNRGPDRSPDFSQVVVTTQNAMLWYALLPRGVGSPERDDVAFDAQMRQFKIKYVDGRVVTLSADGFLPSDRSALPIVQRQQARFEAYRHLREARRISDAGSHELAIREMDASVASAQQASDTVLIEAMRKERAEIMIAAGRVSEADRLFEELVAGANYAAETSYDAARAFHLHGDLDLALKWYRKGSVLRAAAESGKSVHEFLQGMVFVHAERHDWAGGEQEIERFRKIWTNLPSDRNGMYRQFLRWRSGQVPMMTSLDIPFNSTDLLRYWSLEFRLARGDDARTLLQGVDAELAAGSSETQSAMWSLRAELLARLGRRAQARDAVAHAMSLLSDDIGATIIARVHAELVRERAARLGGG